jgi:hypothetical protein
MLAEREGHLKIATLESIGQSIFEKHLVLKGQHFSPAASGPSSTWH